MLNFLKFFASALILLVVSYAGYGIFVLATRSWFQHASFITIGFTVLGFTALCYFAFQTIRKIIKL
jgi:adenylosuccinate lyase